MIHVEPSTRQPGFEGVNGVIVSTSMRLHSIDVAPKTPQDGAAVWARWRGGKHNLGCRGSTIDLVDQVGMADAGQ